MTGIIDPSGVQKRDAHVVGHDLYLCSGIMPFWYFLKTKRPIEFERDHQVSNSRELVE
jgi:hypothetical protein